MVRVAPVRLQYNPKILWFDPKDLDIVDGDAVIVKTERGTEFGHALDIIEVTEEEIEALNSKLKPVLRIATPEDEEELERLKEKSAEALPVFKRLAAEHNENMRPIFVEYLFGGDKAVFFFEAEERIDFRELVRKLSSELKIRVDMRQIGVRDEARIVGGLGHCGQELCCKRLGGEFNPVSIRMAKEQDLSLNPAKISGVCGRLMCCLRYEFETYKEFKSRAPKMNAKIDTPCGACKVCDLDVPREQVTVRLEDETGKRVTFPLSAMDEPEDGARPSSIGDVFDEYANPDPFAETTLGLLDTTGFTRDDQLAEPVARHNAGAKSEEEGSGKKRRRRRRSNKNKTTGEQTSQAQSQSSSSQKNEDAGKQTSRKRRRRRSTSTGSSNASSQGNTSSVRPGQKSSSLKGNRTKSQTKRQPVGETSHRKARRRSHTSGGKQESSNSSK